MVTIMADKDFIQRDALKAEFPETSVLIFFKVSRSDQIELNYTTSSHCYTENNLCSSSQNQYAVAMDLNILVCHICKQLRFQLRNKQSKISPK